MDRRGPVRRVGAIVTGGGLAPAYFFLLGDVSLYTDELTILGLFLIFVYFILALHIFSASLVSYANRVQITSRDNVGTTVGARVVLGAPPTTDAPGFKVGAGFLPDGRVVPLATGGRATELTKARVEIGVISSLPCVLVVYHFITPAIHDVPVYYFLSFGLIPGTLAVPARRTAVGATTDDTTETAIYAVRLFPSSWRRDISGGRSNDIVVLRSSPPFLLGGSYDFRWLSWSFFLLP